MRTKRVAAMLAVMATAMVGVASGASALSTTDRPASILVWPKVVVDSSGVFTGGPAVDTQITISNTNTTGLKQAYCFWVNATSHCAEAPTQACRTATDCDGGALGACVPGWNEIDFQIYLTQDQPLGFYAGQGLSRGEFPLEGPFRCNAPLSYLECYGANDPRCGSIGCNVGQSNLGSGIPPVPEDPFIGSLTCIQYTGDNPTSPDQSSTRDKLMGEAAIVSLGSPVDVAKYNAVGLSANGVPADDNVFGLGAGQEYAACPSTLILSHIFDGATDPIAVSPAQTYGTELTLVPCSNDFNTQVPGRATAQFLVFNEFEQRFSTSRTVDGLFDGAISTIDTRNPARSIFSAGVAGTIAGQTRIRGVGGNTINGEVTNGGLLGVARAVVSNTPSGTASAAYNLHQQGNPSGVDLIVVP